jgi:hypothetical protein
MKNETTDQPTLKSIQRLAAEEHRLFAHEARTDADHARLGEQLAVEFGSALLRLEAFHRS